MAKLISLFNHKGGVSKTTTTFNLGWALANAGHKTLIVDADPQCNLTGLVLDYNEVEDFEQFYAGHDRCDIFEAVRPVLDGQQQPLQSANPIPTANQNLFLLGGNISLSESETQISVALERVFEVAASLAFCPQNRLFGHGRRGVGASIERLPVRKVLPSFPSVSSCTCIVSSDVTSKTGSRHRRNDTRTSQYPWMLRFSAASYGLHK